MVETVDWIFRLRWLLWAAGGVGMILLAACSIRFKRDGKPFQPPAAWLNRSSRLKALCERRFNSILSAIFIGFILLGWLEKNLQLLTFSLNAQDFWLFEDLLRNAAKGGLFLTRFAPQASSIVQHGAVHATWSWLLALPLSWIIGPTQAALAHGPLVLGLASLFVALIARPRFGASGALAFALAFLLSTQVGMVLNYDTHPEAAYPLFVLMLCWALGLGDGKVRWPALLIATLAGIGVKEDSFLVFFPWLIWGALSFQGQQRKASIAAGLLALVAYGWSMYSIGRWSSGAWGPHEWKGIPVVVPAGADLLKGIHWSSPGAMWEVAQALVGSAGGFFEALLKMIRFWVSRPWLSLLILAPWVLKQPRFYLLLGPLALAYSLLERAALLNLYYSAPFLGTFWAIAASTSTKVPSSSSKLPRWALLASCLFGSQTLHFPMPSPERRAIAAELKSAALCIDEIKGHGLVQTPGLGFVDRAKVRTDRVPSKQELLNLDFALFVPGVRTWEMTPAQQAEAMTLLSQTQGWRASDCLRQSSRVQLFVRDSTTPRTAQ